MSSDHLVRCAIYTRTSSKEGLEQQFNSLDAQRASCEQFIRSQISESWAVLPDLYDDGGFSGGSLERPALQRLLGDARDGKFDVVVVYKVDRLTRSLADFFGLIGEFELKDIAFVSVTQAFNTKAPGGRLTLNVLLAFAQFERELSGERIRDKIAASKAKGMWMGGLVPLGYDRPSDGNRALTVNIEEASTVRRIFELYLSTRNLLALQRRLAAEDIRSKPRLSAAGEDVGGKDFSRGALRHLLQNRVYLGETTHLGVSHAGRHTALIDLQLFLRVQAVLRGRSQKRQAHWADAGALWCGKVFDEFGQKMKTTGSNNRGRSYRYYQAPPADVDRGNDVVRRVPFGELDRQVMCRLEALAGECVRQAPRRTVRASLARVDVASDHLRFLFDRRALCDLGHKDMSAADIRARLPPGDRLLADVGPAQIGVHVPGRIRLRQGRTWAQHPDRGSEVRARPVDAQGLDRLRCAHQALKVANSSSVRGSATTAASSEVHLAFLAPDLQEALMRGEMKMSALEEIRDLLDLPLSWEAQRARFEHSIASDSRSTDLRPETHSRCPTG